LSEQKRNILEALDANQYEVLKLRALQNLKERGLEGLKGIPPRALVDDEIYNLWESETSAESKSLFADSD
jgi:hypothetical protein